MSASEPFRDTEPPAGSDCPWCSGAALCGAAAGKPPASCPMKGNNAPTAADAIRLVLVAMVSINGRIAALEALLRKHGHIPGGQA